MVVKTFENLRVLNILCNAQHVFVYKHQRAVVFFQFNEFFTRDLALRAPFGSGVTFVDISANGASEFCHNYECFKC